MRVEGWLPPHPPPRQPLVLALALSTSNLTSHLGMGGAKKSAHHTLFPLANGNEVHVRSVCVAILWALGQTSPNDLPPNLPWTVTIPPALGTTPS